jgi:glycosyltransferase involved in cell wall biosynthesis
LLSFVVLPVALGSALALRSRRPQRPRVVFGTTPIINTKYWARALRAQGYDARAYAYDVYAIFRRDDFDHVASDFLPWLFRFAGFRIARKYVIFLWALWSFEVFVFDFDGGFLRKTPLERLELPLLRLARRPVVAIPYGADVIDVRRCPHEPTRAALLRDYPQLLEQAESIAARACHYGRWVAFVVCGGNMTDYTPRCDLVVPSALAIDVDEWQSSEDAPPTDQVRVLHAPNHRAIKGTELVIEACELLVAEGLPVELVLLEGVPNEEVRREMDRSHIVASAFVMGYYELFAVEGMSMSRPVLNYLRPDLKALHEEWSFGRECPIVDTPPDRIADRIRALALDPEERRRLGEKGRQYVEQRHSYAAMGSVLAEIVSHVWQN